MKNFISIKNTIAIVFSALITAFILSGCQPRPQTAEEVIAQIANIDSLKKIEADTLFAESWELWFSMPQDHNNPNGEHFPLRVIYSHNDFNNPMVIAIEGYKIYTPRATEPTKLLNANQINIEHRFFENSRPKDSIPWAYLDIFQAATDHHAIINAFKPFYKSKWVSTGISKGGQATIFHRSLYPNDVDVSIPYVAPLNFSSEDERVYQFLANVSTPQCRERVRAFQEELFKRKEKLMPMLEQLAKDKNYKFGFGLSRAYDVNVLEYDFGFWQWGGLDCSQIPNATATDEELFNHWVNIASFTFIEDSGVDAVRPFFYQAMTEIGMYGYEVKPWSRFLSDTTNITFDFTMPKGHKAIFDPEPMQRVNQWVQNDGNYMLYIYGEDDPWSATAVVPGEKTNAVRYIKSNGDHRTRIHSFPEETQKEIYSTLEEWLELEINK
ncbi:MAG: S28 family serine protease [Tenuifilaceae bacterium]|nr:S28 family serine protease [Tenuifilaceae bacterium]